MKSVPLSKRKWLLLAENRIISIAETLLCHPEPGPELDSGSPISGSPNTLIYIDSEKISE